MGSIGKNNEYIQRENQRVILQILSEQEFCTRAELSRKTGLTQAAITKIISRLIEKGVVQETGLVEGRGGRRSIGISLNADKYKIMGVKIARKSFDVAIFNFRSELLQQVHKIINISLGARSAVESIRQEMQQMIREHSNVVAIGIAVPGPYLSKKGRVAIMSEFSGWEEINICEEFANTFDLPVFIEHDANAGALALWHYKKERHGSGTLVHFLASEGIGAGVVMDGHLLRGSSGIAGEVGHMSINMHGPKCACGNCGCLEGYSSSIAFAKRTKELLRKHPESSLRNEKRITAATIFAHMNAGDAFSQERVRDVGRYIGYGLANVTYLYDPDEIVITDIMTGGGEVMLNAIKETVQQRVLPELYENISIRLERAEVDVILAGAAALATEGILAQPEILCGID